MAFTSLHFALFFIIVLSGLLVLRRNEHKISFLLLAGVVFYGYWDWRFLALIGFTSIFDFYMGLRIAEAQGTRRKQLLICDVLVNLSLLATFKYFNFFLESANTLLAPLGTEFRYLHIALPIGISFFVFEAISYCVDIYRGTLQPYKDWRHFALFIFFFPRMVAGPIIRPSDFLPQLQREIRLTRPNFYVGGQMFLMGMVKKLVIADNLAPFVDLVFTDPSQYSATTVLQAIIAYSIQIFCDFSGYSDMALGLAKILGFDLPVNFRMPYAAANITDFWRRWHISLSSWLRDYLYIPLGGNRHGVPRTYLNLLITMTLGGLWHGAAWHFVVWGVLHGVGLIVHKLFIGLRAHWRWRGDDIVSRSVSWALTYVFVCICWVFFRAQSFEDAVICLQKVAGLLPGGLIWLNGPLMVVIPLIVLAHLFGLWQERHGRTLQWNPRRLSHLVALFSCLIAIFFLRAIEASPFIYFQF
ncbi:MAG: alginate O-acetyltransferase complex protein AlgI [Abditibacteriota bacterium]|nr:alginate O-acetyltransferase complex protein AlgI [Abditibacteriota bacterium]